MNEIPKRGRGRPKSSKSFRLVPVPHPKPEHHKIGAALLALAIHQQELDEAAKKEASHE